jgi:hypothetical protein
MNNALVTAHAAARMQQRGIRIDDHELIMLIGTEVGEGYLVLTRDCQEAERQLKELLRRIWRVCGKQIIVSNGRIVTAYHASRRSNRGRR